MKIIHVILGKANPNRMNGVNKVVHNLATSQVEIGNEVFVFGLVNNFNNDKLHREYNLNLFKRRKFRIDEKLKDKIVSFKGSNVIFHIHGGFIIDFFFIAKIIRKNGFNFIFTPHGCYNTVAMEKSKFQKMIFLKLFDGFIINAAWKLQCLGKSEMTNLTKLGFSRNLALIPNGQNLGDLSYKFTHKYKSNSLVFGFVGRIDTYHKGLDLLIKGFINYIKGRGTGDLWVIGDGPGLDLLKSIVLKKELNSRIKFFGSIFGNEKLELISLFDVFVHPSRYEGFPMSVLESAGLGIPLLVSKETNFEDYVVKYNCGKVLKCNDISEIEKELMGFDMLYENNELLILSRNAIKMIEEEFNWSNISKKLLSGLNNENFE